MTDEPIILPESKPTADWEYLFWPALFGFIVGVIIGLVLGNQPEEAPIDQRCKAICKEVKSFNEATGECECMEVGK